MKEASFYEVLNNNTLKCTLCPHYCIIKNNNFGKCIIRENINGKLFTNVFEQISSIALDPIEKKPLYHFYPGKNILSIGTNGCNLKCPFCQNWQISMQKTYTEQITFSKLINTIKQTNSIGIAYTYNEPLIAYEFLLNYSEKIRNSGLKNIIVSNGMINPEPLTKLIPFIDAANIDLKGFSEDFYKYINGNLKTVKNNIVSLFSNNIFVELTFLLIPTKNDNETYFENMCKWIASINNEIPLHISRYFPNYKETIMPTPINMLEKFYLIAKQYLKFVYIGNANIKNTKNTYCPKCNNLLIERNNLIKINLKDSRCSNCSYSPYLVL